MKNLLVIIFLLSSISIGLSQTGFLSNRNVISVEFFANSPVLINSKNPQFALKNGKMTERKEWINYGYGLYYVRQIKKNLAFGLELNAKKIDIEGPESLIIVNESDNFENEKTIWLRANPLKTTVFSGMLRFEFYNKLGNGPVGIAHVLGVGMSLTKAVEKAYDYSLNEFGNTENFESRWTAPDKFFLEKNWPLVKSIGLQYGVQMRYPIGKNLSLNFGLKSLINFTLPMKKEKLASTDNSPYLLEKSYYELRRENVFSINLNAGVSYHF